MKNTIKSISETLFKLLAGAALNKENNFAETIAHWDENDWRTAKTVMIIHGMSPLWGRLIEIGRVFPGMPQSLAEFLVSQYYENTERVNLILREYNRLAEKFSASQIKFMPFKGVELCRRLYEEPGTRPMADIDLYVGSDHVERVKSVLKELRYTFHVEGEEGATLYLEGYLDQAREADADAYWHGATLMTEKNSKWYEGEKIDVPFSIDIHYNMRMNRHFTRYDLTSHFENANQSDERVLPSEVNFVYLALHCSKHLLSCSGRWIQLHDLMLFMTRNNLNVEKIVKLSSELDISHLVLLPVVLVRKVFNVSLANLEAGLGKQAGLRYRWLINNSELSEMSCCNPWGTNLLTSLAWVRNADDLINGIRYEIRKSKQGMAHVAGENRKGNSLLRRLFRIAKSNLKRKPRPLWNMLEIQGLDPNLDWK